MQENYPYSKISQAKVDWSNGVKYPPLIDKENYLLPFKTYESQGYKTPAQRIYFDKKKAWGSSEAATIKSYLSRGIAIVAGMHAMGSPAFRSYNGVSYIERECPKYVSDHQIVIAGYGNKNGVPVWIVKNSWGKSWGSNGFFYVP